MKSLKTNRADPDFKRQLFEQAEGERVSACFTCRTCTASCPVSAVDDKFNPLKVMRMALYGFKEEVLSSGFIWLCSACYACQERCPQGVAITEFMALLKNLAVKEGHVPPGIRVQRDLVKGEGRIYPIDEFDNKKRGKIGLPLLPTTCEVVKRLIHERDPS